MFSFGAKFGAGREGLRTFYERGYKPFNSSWLTADFAAIERRIYNGYISRGYLPGIHDELIAPPGATADYVRRDLELTETLVRRMQAAEDAAFISPAVHPSYTGRTLFGYPIVTDPALGPHEVRFGRATFGVDWGTGERTFSLDLETNNGVTMQSEKKTRKTEAIVRDLRKAKRESAAADAQLNAARIAYDKAAAAQSAARDRVSELRGELDRSIA